MTPIEWVTSGWLQIATQIKIEYPSYAKQASEQLYILGKQSNNQSW